MKYISTFIDKFKKEEESVLYTKITAANHKDFRARNEDFTDREVNDLTSFIKDNLDLDCGFEHSYKKVPQKLNGKITRYLNKKVLIVNKKNFLQKTKKISIAKCADDWFIVVYYQQNPLSNMKYATSRADKCDTIEGVKQSLLNFKKIIFK